MYGFLLALAHGWNKIERFNKGCSRLDILPDELPADSIRSGVNI